MNKISMLLLFICLLLAGCNSDTMDSPLYEGKSLLVGVVGDAPSIREKNGGKHQKPGVNDDRLLLWFLVLACCH